MRRDVDRTHVVDIADDLIGLDGLAGFSPQWVRGLSQQPTNRENRRQSKDEFHVTSPKFECDRNILPESYTRLHVQNDSHQQNKGSSLSYGNRV